LHFSHDELKKCYREAVGKYHPDRYGSSSLRDRENAEMLMKQVNEAYEKLKVFAETV
jgi:DnaJ-class molecular chaperone